MSEKYNSLTKVAQSLSHMSSEKEKHAVLSRYEQYGYDEQVKIARCYLFLQEQEKATKEAAENGEAVDTISFKSAATRLDAAIELAHYQALMEDETIQKKAEEAAAAGALMASLLVDHVNEQKTAAGMPPQFAAMKNKMQKAEDGDGDGKKLEGTKGEHSFPPKKDKKDKDEDEDKDED